MLDSLVSRRLAIVSCNDAAAAESLFFLSFTHFTHEEMLQRNHIPRLVSDFLQCPINARKTS